jgi:hypothetical protein
MIVGRLLYGGSKLALSNQRKNTTLWEQCGTEGKVDVEAHCYQAMDRLLERQSAIQRTLASRHLKDGHLVLYDITSSYFEGAYTQSDIVTSGYNRDGKRGHEQMVIALFCSAEGCPVGVEVFAGNTQDATTVPDKIAQLHAQYGLKEIIFVGDRGMITHAVAQKIKGTEGLYTISALTHRQIVELLGRKVISPELFDEQRIVEVLDPEDTTRRYCLCRNPQTARREATTRQRLLDRARAQLEKIAGSRRRATEKRLGARVGRVLERTKMGKFIRWQVLEGKLLWSFDQDKIAAERLFDGCYIVSCDVPQEQMAAVEVVASYKKLGLVEEAFRNLKTVQHRSASGLSQDRRADPKPRVSVHPPLPTICNGISWSLCLPLTAPTKIDNGRCATSSSAWRRSAAKRSSWQESNSTKSPFLKPTSKRSLTISK